MHDLAAPSEVTMSAYAGGAVGYANAVNAFRTNSKTVCECDGNYEHALFPDDATELSGFTPSFLWLLRDFYLDLEEDGRKVCIIGSCTHCTLVDHLR